MDKKFKKIFQEYKKGMIKLKQHRVSSQDEIREEALTKTHEALRNNYTYKFHQKPTKERADMINLIQHYVSEAILPPVLQKIEDQIVIQNHKHDLAISMLEKILETLSTPQDKKDKK